ncbi:hypothetical protein H2204_000869 [Knufia peltigerae]|nr:hypothetical protein H2204_000869 [Knufia peltigerae]
MSFLKSPSRRLFLANEFNGQLQRQPMPICVSFKPQIRTVSQQEPNLRGRRPGPKNDPSYPSFSFAGLGASRTVRVTVLAALGVLGTLETIFWAKALWRYFYPSTEATSEDE